MTTLCAILACFVIPLAFYSPQPESLREVNPQSLGERLRSRAGTLGLGILLIAIAAATFDPLTLETTPKLKVAFGLSHWGVFEMGWIYQILTGNFLHADLAHLVSNLFILMLLSAYESRVGFMRYILVFHVSAIGSSIAEAILIPPTLISIGASGGICGLVAGYFLDFPEVPSKDWIGGVMAVLILVAFFSLTGKSNERELGVTVDWLGHFLGAVCGCMFVRRFPRAEEIPVSPGPAGNVGST